MRKTKQCKDVQIRSLNGYLQAVKCDYSQGHESSHYDSGKDVYWKSEGDAPAGD